MENIRFVFDKSTGLRKLEDDKMIKRFTIPTIEQYKVATAPEEIISFKEIRIKIKEKFIHPSSIDKIANRYPDIGLKKIKEYIIPELQPVEKFIQLPKSANDLLKIYKQITINNKETLNIAPSDILFWLCLFCKYGVEFCASYDEYVTDIDESADFIDNLNTYAESKVKTIAREKPFDSNDIKATCHLLLISMNKTFIATQLERDRQLKTYLKNRKSAVYSSLGVPMGELLVTDDFFLDIGEVYRAIPKLRTMLFYFCYQNQTLPEFSTAMVLLANSAMTTIKAMIDFINQPEKSQAHAEPVILEEIGRFVKVIKKKKEKDGALWPYHRILNPTDGELNAANFPNLAVASIEYFKKFGSETFKYMVTPTVSVYAGIKDKATTLDTRDIYVKAKKEFGELELEGAKEIGLDVNKLMGTRTGRETASTSEIQMEQLREALLQVFASTSKP